MTPRRDRVWARAIVTLTGLLTLAASFLPWYQTRWDSSTNGVDSQQTNYASAWTASTGWSSAVTIALTASVVWLLLGRAPEHWAIRAVRWACPVLIAAAIVLTIRVWQVIPVASLSGGGAWASSSSDQGSIGTIVRDHLIILDVDGHQRDVAWGLYAGLTAMVLTVVAMTMPVAIRRLEHRMSRRHHSPGTSSGSRPD